MNATAERPLLEVRGLAKRYPGVHALDGVDFDVLAGEVHFVLGQNGAGKSTLIKCVSGAVEPTGGTITLDGERVPSGDPKAALRLGIATIYQELDLVGHLSAAANIWLGHERRTGPFLNRPAMRAEATMLFKRLGHPHIDPATPVERLRPAEQQVVSIARALSHRVRLLIMDEPSAILDEHEIETLFEVVARLNAEKVGVIYISHRLNEVPRIADRVTVLKDGATAITGAPPDTPQGELVRAMVGRSLEALFPPARQSSEGDVILEVKNLTRAPYVRDVTFSLQAGEVLGIAGLVGSGRSELLRCVYGVDPYERGEVILQGRPVAAHRPDIARDSGIGLAPEDRKSQALLLDWSLATNVSIAALARFKRGPLLDVAAERAQAREQLVALATEPSDPRRIARELSGGNQQKVVLARWLLRSSKVLLLDEPTRGVDIGAKAEIYKVIREFSERGCGVVMVSSELPEIVGFCDRILVMRDGEMVAEAQGGSITEEEILALCVHSSASEVRTEAS
ncbi:MAG: sugar ABC transporter ATP-binding protein [Actinomycetota bacterium]